jgi:polyphosphate kinase 2 (PPK2 family)
VSKQCHIKRLDSRNYLGELELAIKQEELAEWYKRAQEEILDDLDEELELEMDDLRLSDDSESVNSLNRQLYFRELFRLQKELIKLQDWVVHKKLKVVVLFEGRDSAGKGGAIKRITQRLNPRVCRVVALTAPSEREKTQW